MVFVNSLAGLDDAAARGIAERVIGQAPGLTTGQLAARLRRLVLAEHPQVAAARARQEVKERRVAAYLGDNALASLAGYELAPHRVAAAMERLSGIAKAAKAAGDQRRLDQLRADVFLDLLVGDGVADGGPITSGNLPTARDHADPAAGSPTAPDAATPWPAAPADPLAHTMPEHPHPEHAMPEPAAPEPTPGAYGGPGGGGGRQAREGAQPGPAQPDPHESQESQEWADPEAETLRELYYRGFGQLPTTRPNPGTGHPAGTSSRKPAIRPAPRRGVVDLQVPLTTLLRLTELPGELEGFGPVIADIARQVAAHPDTQWRYSIYNKLGELVQHGITHARPQPRRRHPTAATTAHVRARDRTCRAPGCRRPARHCDLDHITAWAQHGDTHPGNLAALCPRHHAFKGTTGTELAQIGATLAWKTPTGRHYTTHPARYHEPEHRLPPPDP